MDNTERFSRKLGFIGAGNMATAMMSGIVSGGIFSSEDVRCKRGTPCVH